MAPRPFRFAVQASGAPSAAAWRTRARTIESLGYDTLYVPDHLEDQWGPLVALTVAAEATTTLKVGPLVLDNDFRHPVVLAKEVATLDLVAEGRLELGLGAGWQRSDYDSSGIPMDPPGVRIERLEESLAVMDALWREGRATVSGPHYQVHEAVGSPTPHRRPRPTLVIGGGSRRILSLAGREADIASVVPSLAAGVIGPEMAAEALVERYRQRVAWVQEAAGARAPEVELQCWTMLAQVVPDARALFEQMAPVFSLTPEQLAQVPAAVVGSVDQICDTLEARRQELGFSYLVIRDNEAEGFAPVVERLAGR
jgi:probable F420-dependent oxidoreductase